MVIIMKNIEVLFYHYGIKTQFIVDTITRDENYTPKDYYHECLKSGWDWGKGIYSFYNLDDGKFEDGTFILN